ncbi:DUF1402 family protein [Pseudochrobactrum sp. sp1633]|uniref:DUF1402 family protein n=1 Tax=Pseudochrobactrum sp. sp1633 TaxID=3036706 RepID=UPI0025A4CE1C|nr:DUF1402 family protein [Pseudochrobactrum sp. sp1633]MDM8344982.1 DUF1402 family protein [Pseudochrobactrum sp. sp1633]HWD14814.1 DUF1402 family protein [Pseudochrobactrum sp.]
MNLGNSFKRIAIAAGTGFFALSSLSAAQATTLVPAGNRNAEQPAIPGASANRTKKMNTTYEAKYQKIYGLLKSDRALRTKIKSAAAAYNIDPVHIAGAIIGEHTYNVDAYDQLQTYYVKAISYVKQGVSFSYKGESVSDFVKRPEFEKCAGLSESYALWTCRENIWDSKFRGKKVGGTSYPNNRFAAVFFQPFYAGQTFGLGQISPLTALQMSDMVNRVSGLPKLSADDGAQVYKTIMDPDLSLSYMAATIKHSINSYKKYADFDISKNPGITATLYNTGGADVRARALASANAGKQDKLMPQENYYGWLVNSKMDDLQSLF